MILVSFGCDKCGNTESQRVPERFSWHTHTGVNMPGGWGYDEDSQRLLCYSCKLTKGLSE